MNKIISSVLITLTLASPLWGQMGDAARTSTGVVVADRKVSLAAKIVGRIVDVKVEEGDGVKTSEVLIDIDDAELRAELSSAQAALDQEQVNLTHMKKLDDRYRKLLSQNATSTEKADEVVFNYGVAKARVKRAQAMVAKVEAMLRETKIRAPFSGVIIEKRAELGQVTAAGEPLLTLEDQSTLKFRTSVKEQDLLSIKRKQKINITIDALNDLKLTGMVSKIIPSGDTSTHEFVVEAILPAQDGLYPGMFGKAEFSR
ncbi:MAG: efflux RND transporter periplasmic adaptor subunit [Gammaproteobacteria bacterium]|nr:efflux RND transporter periplasmic adaptor subunit [Gammaproteobacteria bacterium]